MPDTKRTPPRRPSEQDADELPPIVVDAPEVSRSEVAPTYAPGEHANPSRLRLRDGFGHLRSALPPRTRA